MLTVHISSEIIPMEPQTGR
jgi:hypothetical protein